MPGKLEENTEEVFIEELGVSFKFKYPRGANVTANVEVVSDYEDYTSDEEMITAK